MSEIRTAETLTLGCASDPEDGLILSQDGIDLMLKVEEGDQVCTMILSLDTEATLFSWLQERQAQRERGV